MNIQGKITGISYHPQLAERLEDVDFQDFDVNKMPVACKINDNEKQFALSKWVSPKRTRSYPYERVYNTLRFSKKITIIPVIKDEGAKGDRDFVQWDTISFMGLLDVYVILGYYNSAEKHPTRPHKITKQQFDNQFIKEKINAIGLYHSSALHWNLKQMNDDFLQTVERAKNAYQRISQELNVNLHGMQGIDRFIHKIRESTHHFMQFSRQKAKEAQNREFQTIQPKEVLASLTKAKITISNYLGGKYFLTVDEIKITDNQVFLIESKHGRGILPSKGDIKDRLLKLILYSNLSQITINDKFYKSIPILKLTSDRIQGEISSKNNTIEIVDFFNKNKLRKPHKNLITKLFQEANLNQLKVIIQEK